MAARETPAEERLAPLAADADTAGSSRRSIPASAERVVEHALFVLGDEPDDQEVDDFGKRQERRVEKGDEEQARSAECHAKPCTQVTKRSIL